MAKRIYVGNLPWAYTNVELEQLFQQYGEVATAEVIMDRETGRSRGFGFVEMASKTEGQAAIDQFGGRELDGRALTVNEAKPQENRGGGGGGGGRGGGRSGGGGYGSRW